MNITTRPTVTEVRLAFERGRAAVISGAGSSMPGNDWDLKKAHTLGWEYEKLLSDVLPRHSAGTR